MEEETGDEELPGDLGDDPRPMAEELNKSAQIWNNSVSLTGGALAFHKCSYKLLSFEPRSGRMEIRLPSEMPYDFTLHDHHGQASSIQQTSALRPTRGLGFLFSPSTVTRPRNLSIEWTKYQRFYIASRLLPSHRQT